MSLSKCSDVTCIRSNQEESKNQFGGFMKKLKIEQSYSKVRFSDFLQFFSLIFSYQNIETITAIDCDKKELSRSVEQNKSVRW